MSLNGALFRLILFSFNLENFLKSFPGLWKAVLKKRFEKKEQKERIKTNWTYLNFHSIPVSLLFLNLKIIADI